MNSLVFLDIDGVLNTIGLWQVGPLAFSEEAVNNLAHLLKATNSHVVISSTWRLGGGSDLALALAPFGDDGAFIRSRVVGVTGEAETREKEVLDYVSDHPFSAFVAIDDTPELFPSKPSWLVVTNPMRGLDRSAMYRAIGVLTVRDAGLRQYLESIP